MEAIEFIRKYSEYDQEIEMVVKDEYQPVIEKLKQIDPHDLIPYEAWFLNNREARGFVWSLFFMELKKDR